MATWAVLLAVIALLIVLAVFGVSAQGFGVPLESRRSDGDGGTKGGTSEPPEVA
jgi:hypothetical protein